MTAMSLIGNRLFSPSASIASPPTPRNSTAPAGRLAQRAHQLEAELIAGMFARDQRDAQRRAHARPAEDEQARRLGRARRSWRDRRSARRPPRSRCPRVRRAAASSIVFSPTAGRSSRMSCPRLAALTNTPARPFRRSRREARMSATRASIASVPSAASTASTRPFATTTPCPTSNGESAPSSAAPARMSACVSASGAARRSTPSGASRAVREILDADDAQPLALEYARDALEQVVVAAAKQSARFRPRA